MSTEDRWVERDQEGWNPNFLALLREVQIEIRSTRGKYISVPYWAVILYNDFSDRHAVLRCAAHSEESRLALLTLQSFHQGHEKIEPPAWVYVYGV